MFKPILAEGDLPPPTAESGETLQLDFKAKEGTKIAEGESFEKAKDVAAFANSLGGTILLGAPPDFRRYVPFTKDDAEAVARRYDEAVRDRCSPGPVFDMSRIPLGGGLVIAVNVWPFPAQPIGVRSASSRDAFAFPLRVGTQTSYLSSDQLPMFMIPEVRRSAILLSSIPKGECQRICVRYPSGARIPHPNCKRVAELCLDASDVGNVIMRNTVKLVDVDSQQEFWLPVDSITHVWECRPGEWQLVTRCHLVWEAEQLVVLPPAM